MKLLFPLLLVIPSPSLSTKLDNSSPGNQLTLLSRFSDFGLRGFNEKRQLGILHRFNQEKPQLIKSLADAGVVIAKVECGQQHVLALSTEGQVFSW